MRYTRNIQKWENDTYPSYQWPYPPNMALLKAQYLNFRILNWPLLSLKSIVMGGTLFSNRPNWFCSARQGGPSCCMALIPVKSTRGASHQYKTTSYGWFHFAATSRTKVGEITTYPTFKAPKSQTQTAALKGTFSAEASVPLVKSWWNLDEILMMQSWWLSDALQDKNSPVLIPTNCWFPF